MHCVVAFTAAMTAVHQTEERCEKHCKLQQRWSNPNCNGKLPPSATGLPLIGDTFEFLASHSPYRPLFRVRLFGQKMVVSTDPEIKYSIFRQENQDLVLWHFGTIQEMVGEKLLASHGSIHRYMKNLVLRMVGSDSLRVKLLHEMDVATQRHLRSWANDGRVLVIDASQKMLLQLVAGKLLGCDESKQAKNWERITKLLKMVLSRCLWTFQEQLSMQVCRHKKEQ
ncbi:hypothetical protein Ddye_017898 [Dipteronia dyeriana]|uniref:Cytochrome P450 n=1 Tax=Dipteronia dyeriana TaxID=168575 RepID=A0AAD9UA40_9ROSI|nr:hypothetical protein Ddye_017898 [Dipteronia dyeriana]